jgi:hypothetical protein
MNEAAAWLRIREDTSASAPPSLTDDEVESLVSFARRSDRYGLAPSDDGWTPTYNLNAAIARGWRIKAGKVAGKFDFSTDGQAFSRSQQHQMCLEMADRYARKANGTISFGLTTGLGVGCTDIAGNVNCG